MTALIPSQRSLGRRNAAGRAHAQEDPVALGEVEVLGQGLAANPRHKELLYWRGRACFRAKNWNEAIKALDALKTIDPSFQDAAEWLKRAMDEQFYSKGSGGGGG